MKVSGFGLYGVQGVGFRLEGLDGVWKDSRVLLGGSGVILSR